MNYKKAVFTAVLLFACVIGAPVWADDTDKEHVHDQSEQHNANVERMLVLMRVPDLVNETAAEVVDLYSAKITGEDVDSNTERLVTAYQKDLATIVNSVLSWDSIKANYINSYAKKMSREEVQAATEFFDSPHGQTFLVNQIGATKEVKQTTKHLVDADLSEPLNQLTAQLRAGLVKINNLPNNNQAAEPDVDDQ